MQACGIVNDHLATCWVRDEVERDECLAYDAPACWTIAYAPCSPASSRRMPRSARRGCPPPCARALSLRRPAGSSSRSSRRRPTARCSRSAVLAATPRSGSLPACATSAAHVLSLESDPLKVDAWRRNIAEAGLEEWAELVEGDARETLAAIDDVFDVVEQYAN